MHTGGSIWTLCTRSRRSCPRTARRWAWCARLWTLALPGSPGCQKLRTCVRLCPTQAPCLRACVHALCFAPRAEACCWHAGAAACARVERPRGQDQRGVPPQGGWCRHQHAGVLSSPSLLPAPCLSMRCRCVLLRALSPWQHFMRTCNITRKTSAAACVGPCATFASGPQAVLRSCTCVCFVVSYGQVPGSS